MHRNWHWRCQACGHHLVWIRDTDAGRCLVLALVRASQRTMQELRDDGTLALLDSEHEGPCLICVCAASEGELRC